VITGTQATAVIETNQATVIKKALVTTMVIATTRTEKEMTTDKDTMVKEDTSKEDSIVTDLIDAMMTDQG